VPSGTPKHSTDPLRCTVASATSLSISTLLALPCSCCAQPKPPGREKFWKWGIFLFHAGTWSGKPNETGREEYDQFSKGKQQININTKDKTKQTQTRTQEMKRTTLRLLPQRTQLTDGSRRLGAWGGGACVRPQRLPRLRSPTTTLRCGYGALRPTRRFVGTKHSQEGAGAATPQAPPPTGWQLHRTGGLIGSAMGFFGGLVGQGGFLLLHSRASWSLVSDWRWWQAAGWWGFR
jgi:hypothetical protein